MSEDIRKMPEDSRWYYILNKVMNFPGVKINREEFLRKTFTKHYNEDKLLAIIESGPGKAGVPLELIDELASKAIAHHERLAVVASAASGIPGGFTMLATMPADVAQYYYHTLQVAQKLAYIYGLPDLEQGGEEEFLEYMTLFIGVMSGVAAATNGIKELSKMIAETALKRLPRMALTKTAIYPIVKQIARLLGVKMTKQIFARGVAKMIPLVGALTSGGLTLVMFSVEANRLKKNLKKDFIS